MKSKFGVNVAYCVHRGEQNIYKVTEVLAVGFTYIYFVIVAMQIKN